MPISAAVEGDGAMAASRTTIPMAAQRSRATALDGVEHTQVQPHQPGLVLLDEALYVFSENIGRLEGCPVHGFCFLRESFTLSGPERLSISRGFATAVRCFRETCR